MYSLASEISAKYTATVLPSTINVVGTSATLSIKTLNIDSFKSSALATALYASIWSFIAFLTVKMLVNVCLSVALEPNSPLDPLLLSDKVLYPPTSLLSIKSCAYANFSSLVKVNHPSSFKKSVKPKSGFSSADIISSGVFALLISPSE